MAKSKHAHEAKVLRQVVLDQADQILDLQDENSDLKRRLAGATSALAAIRGCAEVGLSYDRP